MLDKTVGQGPASEDLGSSIAAGMVAGLSRIIGRYSVYQAAHAAVMHVQSARRVLSITLVTLVLGILGYYATLEFGTASAPLSGSEHFRHIQALFTLCVLFLLIYFVLLRSKQYQIEEVGHINVMLPYEEEHNDSTGPGHEIALGYKDAYWSYSQVDMAAFGCLIAGTTTAFYQLIHMILK